MIFREGSDIGHGLVVALRPPFKRLNNSFRRIGSMRGSARRARPVSLVGPPDIIPKCDNNGTVKTSSGGPAEWAASFEKLLDCTTGLHTFAEFLKKEFSAENIYFWAACERYRKLNPGAERTEEAHRIYQQHLRVGAPEAVNVDSHARQNAEQTLQNVTAALFIPAQKQIFNLMKFDSYSRFLKSDLYKQCLLGTPDKVQLDPNLLLHPTTPSKLKKSLSNAEDRRRKSLLPWHRKNRSKSKDRDVVELAEGNNNNKRCDVNENVAKLYVKSDVHSSRSSLTSLDLAISANTDGSKLCHDQILNPCRPPLCRVNLVNGSTTVVQIKNMETIQQLVQRLLDKRGIVYTSFEVSTDKHSKALNLSEPSSKLAGCEVDVQQKVTFKLDLPNKKVIAVKSKSTKVLEDVLRPILSRYSYTLEEVCVTHNSQRVDVNQSVISVDTLRLNIQLNNPQNVLENIVTQIISKPKMPSLLDELTNQVYEDILQEKSDTTAVKSRSERGSVKSEDWGSENSSSFMGRFIKRDSERNRDRKKKLSTRSKGNSVNSSIEDVTCEPAQQQNGMICKKPLIAKWKAGVKVQNTSESEELYEGLSRAQRSRLEDQRGTEINFELPDFLKDKENDHANKRGFLSAATTIPEATPKMARGGGDVHCNYENRALISEFGNNSNRMYVTSTYQPAELKAPIDNKVVDVGQSSPRAEPPPLPPKPKILPMKPSNWKLRESTRKGGLYLEQPTSSFV